MTEQNNNTYAQNPAGGPSAQQAPPVQPAPPAQAPPPVQPSQSARPAQPPFVPPRPQESQATKGQAKLIIILLICILAVNAAALALQIIQRGAAGMNSRGITFSENGSPPAFQQTPDGSQPGSDNSQ
jgi:hypothetical protein